MDRRRSDPAARAELQQLLDDGDEAALAERFAEPLTFGTAGLRGPMRAGPNGMNVAVVRRAAAGLAAYLRETVAGCRTVVIGYDARHRSRDLRGRQRAGDGRRGAGASNSCRDALPTPVLAYAVTSPRCRRRRHGDGEPQPRAGQRLQGLSRRPADHPATGAQIVPPQDGLIEAAIEATLPATQMPISGDFATLGPEMLDSTWTTSPACRWRRARGRVAYTPLHGVGGAVLLDAFARAGFAAPAVVAAQADPDPDFPTVAFPNPEEPGATDLLLDLAARTGADIAIANDPDADRCAVADSRTATDW